MPRAVPTCPVYGQTAGEAPPASGVAVSWNAPPGSGETRWNGTHRPAPAWPVVFALAAYLTYAASPLAGQATRWTAGVTVSGARFGGASAEAPPTAAGLRFTPYRPTFYGVYLERGTKIRVGLRLSAASPAVSLEGRGPGGGRLLVVSEGAFSVAALGAAVSAPVFLAAPHAGLRLGLGGHWEIWTPVGGPGRALAGVDGSAQFELTLGRHWLTHVSGGAGFDPRSPFAAEDLPNGFQPARMWRLEFGMGVGYRW